MGLVLTNSAYLLCFGALPTGDQRTFGGRVGNSDAYRAEAYVLFVQELKEMHLAHHRQAKPMT